MNKLKPFNYESPEYEYSNQRKEEPEIAARILTALGSASTVLNVGAGAGSYEPADRHVVAVEPSSRMRAQRLARGLPPAVIAKADRLPFDDNSFSASMALLTVHHWPDLHAGLKEVLRVTKERFVIMTFDPEALDEFWNVHYFPELVDIERKRYPAIAELSALSGCIAKVEKVPVPLNCRDGFQEAFYGRPEEFLKKEVRESQSAWGYLAGGDEDRLVIRLASELESGRWDERFGHYRHQPHFTGALRLITLFKQ
ncbi:MAG: class I SAM-dependent methyltransferase [Ignavibacteria bacterium]|nr:class I SAM-dependent methyltransferase [Ignavibacteria bacterium]